MFTRRVRPQNRPSVQFDYTSNVETHKAVATIEVKTRNRQTPHVSLTLFLIAKTHTVDHPWNPRGFRHPHYSGRPFQPTNCSFLLSVEKKYSAFLRKFKKRRLKAEQRKRVLTNEMLTFNGPFSALFRDNRRPWPVLERHGRDVKPSNRLDVAIDRNVNDDGITRVSMTEAERLD